MRHQDAFRLVRTVGLDRVRGRERLYLEVLGEVGDDGVEDTQTQLWAFGEAVLELDTRGWSDIPRLHFKQCQ